MTLLFSFKWAPYLGPQFPGMLPNIINNEHLTHDESKTLSDQWYMLPNIIDTQFPYTKSGSPEFKFNNSEVKYIL
jgi:hypothetical protein